MNVPKLRFKGFTDDYQLIEFGKLVNYQKGFAFKSSDYQNFGTRIIRITDTTSNSIKENDAIFIDNNKAKNYDNYLLKENDIIISSVGSKPPLYDSMVGKVILVPKHANKSLLNQNAIRFRAIKHNQIYLYNYLKQNSYTRFVESIMRGNANQRSIALDDLFKYPIILPSDINEENKVANFLSLLDKKIELQTKKIEDLKLYKKGLNKTIFKNCNNKYQISDIIVEYTEKTAINNQYEVLSSTANGIYLQSKYFNKQAASEDNTGYKIVPKNFITYRSMSDTGEFHFNIQNLIDYGIVSPAYPVFNIDENLVNKDYFVYYINENSEFKNSILHTKEGGTRYALSISKFKSIYAFLPSREEQNRLAKLLKNYNNKLDIEILKLYKLEQLKKGLMQKMFA